MQEHKTYLLLSWNRSNIGLVISRVTNWLFKLPIFDLFKHQLNLIISQHHAPLRSTTNQMELVSAHFCCNEVLPGISLEKNAKKKEQGFLRSIVLQIMLKYCLWRYYAYYQNYIVEKLCYWASHSGQIKCDFK